MVKYVLHKFQMVSIKWHSSNFKQKLNKMKEPKRYYCGNGEGMFEDNKNGHWVEYSEHKAIVDTLTKQLRQPPVVDSVCTCTKFRETPMINGKYICSICNKPIAQTDL